MKIFLTIIFLLVCVALTAIVLMQEGKAAGLGSIGGIGDSYWGKNRGRSMEGNLVKFTKILAAAFLILAIVLNIMPDKTSSSATQNVQPVTESSVSTEAAASTEAAVSTEAERSAVSTEAQTSAVSTEADASAASTEAAQTEPAESETKR